jgi:hypothetical protein
MKLFAERSLRRGLFFTINKKPDRMHTAGLLPAQKAKASAVSRGVSVLREATDAAASTRDKIGCS